MHQLEVRPQGKFDSSILTKRYQNLRKSTRTRQPRSQETIEKSSKAISSVSSDVNSPYTLDPLQDQENQLPDSTAYHQKVRPQTTTPSVRNPACRITRQNTVFGQQINGNGQHPSNLRPQDMPANPPSSGAASPINSSASPADCCSAISTNPVKRMSDNIHIAAPRKKRYIKASDQGDVPAKQWVRKPDSEVSASELARRKKKAEDLATRKREKEAYEKRLLELRNNGVERHPRPCFDCEDRDLQCLVPPVPDPNSRRNKCLECYKGRRTCGDREQGLEPVVPTFTVSAHREKVLNRNLLVDVGGPYYNAQLKAWFTALLRHQQLKQLAEWIDSSLLGIESGELAERPCYPCARAGSVCRKIKMGSLAWRISPKTTRCSNCLTHQNHSSECRSCRPVTDEELTQIQLERTATDFTSVPQIDDTPPMIPDYPQPAHSDSDSQINDAAPVQQDIPATGYQPVQQTDDFPPTSQRTKIPLKAAHEISEAMTVLGKPTDWRNIGLQEFRRKSASAIKLQTLQLLEGDLSSLEDLGTQMGKMYESIRHLSNSSYRLHFKSPSSPMPFTPSNLEAFDILGASGPGPTIMSSIGKLINISPGSTKEQYHTQITEVGINNLSLRKVICAVTSMTLWDLVFQDDPFNDDSRHLSVMRVFENDTNSKQPKCSGIVYSSDHFYSPHEDRKAFGALSYESTGNGRRTQRQP
jgi:hypothetical protein